MDFSYHCSSPVSRRQTEKTLISVIQSSGRNGQESKVEMDSLETVSYTSVLEILYGAQMYHKEWCFVCTVTGIPVHFHIEKDALLHIFCYAPFHQNYHYSIFLITAVTKFFSVTNGQKSITENHPMKKNLHSF